MDTNGSSSILKNPRQTLKWNKNYCYWLSVSQLVQSNTQKWLWNTKHRSDIFQFVHYTREPINIYSFREFLIRWIRSMVHVASILLSLPKAAWRIIYIPRTCNIHDWVRRDYWQHLGIPVFPSSQADSMSPQSRKVPAHAHLRTRQYSTKRPRRMWNNCS